MSLRSSLLGLPLSAGLLALPGCMGAPAEEGHPEFVGKAGEAIQGGYIDTTDTGAVGVGMFHHGFLVGICTGS